MTRSFSYICVIILSSLLIESSAQETKKVIDFSVLDIISQALLRTELKIAELLEIIKKVAVIHHEREFNSKNGSSPMHSLSNSPTEMKLIKYDLSKIRKPKRPMNDVSAKENLVARKSYRSKYSNDDDDEDDTDEDGDSNSNVNTNINTNTNIRKRPSYANFFKK